MPADRDAAQLAADLRTSIGLLVRRLRQSPADGGLTLPESAVLARLDRDGAATPSALARVQQISPQSMGATLAALQARGLVERAPDPHDGRRVVQSITQAGRTALGSRRDARVGLLAQTLASEFTAAERARLQDAAPLLERLAQKL